MKLLTTSVLASLLALGACSSNDQRGDDIGRDTTQVARDPGTLCLPPNCTGSTEQRQGRNATTAKPTIRPKH